MTIIIHLITFIIFSTVNSESFYDYDDRVHLATANALLFQNGKYTTGRRNQPIPQMNCKGIYCSNKPNSIMCKNVAMGDKDVIWECTAHGLTPGYKIESSSVSCEGYNFRDDPYILKGSCGVFYTIDFDHNYKIPLSKTTTQTTRTNRITRDIGGYSTYNQNSYTGSWSNTDAQFIIVFLALAFFFVSYLVIISFDTTLHNPNRTIVWYYPWTWNYHNTYYGSNYDYSEPFSYTKTETINTTTHTVSDGSRDPTESKTFADTIRR